MDIKGGVTIITGSSSGIGAAAARMLAAKGCNVVINFRLSEDLAKEVAADCEAAGAEVLICKANVGEDADCRRMASAAMEKWGRIDGLINSAGMSKFVQHHDLDGLDADDFLDIYRINVIGPYQMTRAVTPHMKAGGQGSIVNISSMAGIRGSGSCIAYAASKGALNTMTQSLARALGPEIRVNSVCPGVVQGRWLKQGLGDNYDRIMANISETTPLKKAGTPEDMAEVATWLIYGGSIMTGETFMVDAGHHLGAPAFRPK